MTDELVAREPCGPEAGQVHESTHIVRRYSGAALADLAQCIGHRIDDGVTVGGLAAHEVKTRRNGYTHAGDRPTRLERFDDRVENAKRQLLRAVPRNLRQQVANRRIAEAFQHGVDVVIEIQTLRSAQARTEILTHEPLHEAVEVRMTDRLVYRFQTCERSD